MSNVLFHRVVCAFSMQKSVCNRLMSLAAGSTCRGQLLPPNSIALNTEVEFIHDGTKFSLSVTKSSTSTYFIVMNNSTVDVETHKLSDGGLLISYDGIYASYAKHHQE